MKKIIWNLENKRYNNVFWFLVDGLRPDFLHIHETEGRNFIDQLLLKGSVFDHVVTAGSGTQTSMHSIFSSLLPSYNGATGWDRKALRQFRQDIFTITDYFQMAGYETFFYEDGFGVHALPMSGFKRWESSGYRIGRILSNTDLMKTERRDQFVEDVNRCKSNKFVYHHLELLHELNGESGTFWTSEQYAKNVAVTAEEFEKLYYEYDISEDDLVIIASDHGVVLDKDYVQDALQNENRQYEESVKAFFALIGRDIPRQCLSGPISSLDEAPTLCHLVFGGEAVMLGQGHDQYDYLFQGKYQSSIFFREKGSWGGSVRETWSPMKADLFYVRDGKWKYVYGENDPRCEWLINLEENQDYEVNLKDQYPELTKYYRQMLEDTFGGAEHFSYQPALGFHKADISPEFSLILQMDYVEPGTMESLLDMAGPCYEIVAPESETTLRYQNQYKMHYVKASDMGKMEEVCQGEWLVYITENGEWSEYFLSDLYRYMQCHRNRNVKIIGEHYIAVRREEAKNYAGAVLHEKKRVRDVRFIHKNMPEKKYILFGCGTIGKDAVNYFGDSSIAYFADNNAGMVGREVYGKRVISFSELKDLHHDYTVVITTNAEFAEKISSQLEKNGIYDYWRLEENERNSPESCWESRYQMVKPERK